MTVFTVSKTVSKTHPFRVERDGEEICICASEEDAQTICEALSLTMKE
jgi:hypothetical protein